MEKYCPTQHGKFTGYLPEYGIERKWPGGRKMIKWKRVEFTRDPDGIPSPLAFGGILRTINLLGYWQAASIGTTFAAFRESRKNERVKIRVVPYEIVYDIKAKRIVRGA